MKNGTAHPIRSASSLLGISKRSGFTLVELLVVITIIAVLVALSFTGLRRYMDSATTTTAMIRIKTLQLTNATYAADNNGKFCPLWTTDTDGATGYGKSWCYNPEFYDLLGKGVRKSNGDFSETVLDPVVVKAGKADRFQLRNNFGYIEDNMPGRNWSSGGASSDTELSKDPNRRWSTFTLHDPARMAAFITSTDFIGKYSGRYKWEANPTEGAQEGKVAYRHGGKMIAVFYDGHTEAISIGKIKQIDATGGGRNNVFWGGKSYSN